MSFPSKNELERVRKKIKNIKPTAVLSSSASVADQLKFALCKEFVVYLRTHQISQLELAKELGVDPARVSEIVKYKINLFTVDRLLELLEQLIPKIKVTLA